MDTFKHLYEFLQSHEDDSIYKWLQEHWVGKDKQESLLRLFTGLNLIDKLKKQGVNLHSASEHLNLQNHEKIILQKILEAHNEVVGISNRIKTTIRHKKEQGIYIHRPSYGQAVINDPEIPNRRIMGVNDEEARNIAICISKKSDASYKYFSRNKITKNGQKFRKTSIKYLIKKYRHLTNSDGVNPLEMRIREYYLNMMDE